MNDLKGFITNFLTTIDYPDNKEEFVDKLISSIYLETVNDLLNLQLLDKQEEIKKELTTAQTADGFLSVINRNFDQKTFQETLKKTSQKVFAEYLETINPVLTDEQKNKLQEFFTSSQTQGSNQAIA